jgi:hypothetical protein
MTKPDNALADEPLSMSRYWLHLVAWSMLLAAALIAFALAMAAGAKLLDNGDATDLTVFAISLPLSLGLIYPLWRWVPDFAMGEPNTARGNRLRLLVLGVGLVGGAVAVPILLASESTDILVLYSNSALSTQPAMIAVAIWALAVPVLILVGRKNADEHALAAGDYGMAMGFTFFVYITPMWWMSWRAGLMPEPDAMILLIGTLIVSTIVNLWKRST